MANYNPNTSGLVSLADRSVNERTTIQSKGGIASGKKRRELKRMVEIVQCIRQESPEDPVEKAIKALLAGLNDFGTSTNDILKGLNFIRELETSSPLPAQQTVYKYITQEEREEIEKHIKAVIGDTSDD